MHSRRAILVLGATATAGLTAGCTGFITGDEPLVLEAQRAAPSDEVLEETGFEEERVEAEEIQEVVDVGVEREIRATFWAAAYTHEVDLGGQAAEAAVFSVVSIPGMEVLGSQQNPIADMDSEELLTEFRGDIDTDQGDIRDVTYRSSYELEILGETRTVDIFDAVAERNGETYDVVVEVTHFGHEDDILVLAGIYPGEVTEEPPIESLMESVEHPV